MQKIVFMGTPEFSVPILETLAKTHHILAVYTQPDRPVGRGQEVRFCPVKKKALEMNLPVFQPEKLSAPGEYERLATLRPDVIVVVAFGQILKKNVLDLPPLGCINIHTSLLPRWRGAAPIQRAILAGDTETGVTTMLMAERLDAGPILLQKKTPITPEDTAGTLHDRLAQLACELILPTIDGLSHGKLRGTPQDEGEVTFAEKLNKEMEVLQPSRSAIELDRHIRALNPWPGTSVRIKIAGNPRLKIRQATLRAGINGREGMLFEKVGMLLLGTASGCLELHRVQWEGKKEVSTNDFLNGLRGHGQSLPLEIVSEP